jgi:hypothetical protein
VQLVFALVLALAAACGEGTIDGNGADGAVGGPDAAGEFTDAAAGSADSMLLPPDAAAYACDFDDPRAPPPGVLWAAPLAASGAETLAGHGHDDQFGPVGYCPGTPVAGQPFYRLIAAGFETDVDIDGDNQAGDDALGVDFWRDSQGFTGFGESGGRVNVYLHVVDGDGNVLNRDNAPGLTFRRTIHDGPVDDIAVDAKPANEFQTNFAMIGGGARYAAEVVGASDRVINMRLPVNHHVTYVLVFRREM